LDTDADRMEALDIEIEEIESRQHRWSPEQLAKAGAIATIGSGGALLIHRGLVRPNDAAALKPRRGAGASTVAGTKATSKPVEDLSARLTLRLSAHRTAILQGAVAARPHLALALLAFALLKDYCYRGTREWSILRLRAPELVPLEQHAGELASARHWIDRNDQLNAMQETLPPATELLGWLIAQPLERLTQLLADCIAMSVDTLLTSGDDGAERERTIKTVVAAAGIDFADYWQPTRATLLDHIPRGALEELVGELAGDLSLSRLSGLKKAEAAESAEQMVANSRWLPKLMRFASPRVPADNVTPTLKPNAKAKAPVNSNGSGARAGATKPAAKKGKAVGNSSKTPAKPKAAKAVKTATKPAAKKSAPPAAKKPAKKGGKA
ncbi:MAG TPA: hypothetical protein VMR06_08360, partial [Dokdonella sp.]|nr:hypothetical protein [Dokdonella sp.]